MAYQQKFRLDGELAVITGGGRAIGLCCAEALAEAGARVVVIERSETDAAQAIALRKKGHDVQLRLGDVTDSARMEEIAAELELNGRAATVLVNNAGIGQSGIASEDVADADWLRMMNVNVNGVFWCSRAFALAGGQSSTSARCPASSAIVPSRRRPTMSPRQLCTT